MLFYVFWAVIVAALGWFLLPHALRLYASFRLRLLCRARKAIVLSYDDGPSAEFMPRLLDLLARKEARATFFLLGRNLQARQEAVAQLQRQGHEVGSHTFHHSNAWRSWPWVAGRDLGKGLGLVRLLGAEGELFRPPYGKATLVTLAQCWAQRLRPVWWTIDPRDTWARRPAQDVVAEIAQQGGGVVLMHDLDHVSPSQGDLPHQDYILDLTQRIIDFAAEEGFRIMPVGELYAAPTR